MSAFQLMAVTFISLLSWLSCSKEVKTSYIDLDTGMEVMLVENEATGEMVNAETWKPVRLYVNTKTKDTIHGPTGRIVNNKLIRMSNNKYIYSEDDDYYNLRVGGDTVDEKAKDKSPSDSVAIERKKRNEIKRKERIDDVVIKVGDEKVEINEETGERKVKKKD